MADDSNFTRDSVRLADKAARAPMPSNRSNVFETIRNKRQWHTPPDPEAAKLGFRDWHSRGYLPHFEDEYYPHQLVGLDVVTREGEELGRLSEVLFTSANEIYVVAGTRGQILLPAIADVIDRVDLQEGTIVVNLIHGLI